MAYLLTRTFTTTCPAKLLTAINNDPEIGALLEQIINDGGPNTDFWFDSALDAIEEAQFDTILGNWNCDDPGNDLPPDDDEVIIDQKIDHKRDKIAGIEGRGNSWMDFDFVTGELTLIPNPNKGLTEYKVWSDNKLYVKQNESLILPSLASVYIVYFDNDGVLSYIESEVTTDIAERNAIIARVEVNVTDNTFISILDLRYDVQMSPATRKTFLDMHGVVYKEGLALQNITTDASGDLDSHAQFGVEHGRIELADIFYETINRQQDLLFPAKIPIYYKIGQYWKEKYQDDFPIIYAGSVGNDYLDAGLPYNVIDPITGDGTLEEVPEHDYVLVHYFATPGLYDGIVGFQGQNAYRTRRLARDGAIEEINNLIVTDTARRYFTPIATVIFQSSIDKNNTPKASIVSTEEGDDYVDFRFSKTSFTSRDPIHGVYVRDKNFLIVDDRMQKLQFDLSKTDPMMDDLITWTIGLHDVDFRTVPNYHLYARASMPLTAMQEVSMDVNGNIQAYPASGGEGSSEYTTRSVQKVSMAYTSQNTGIIGFNDGTPNTIFLRVGSQQQDGSITWGEENTVTTSGNPIEINSIKIDDTHCACCWVTDTGAFQVVVGEVNHSDQSLTTGPVHTLESSGVVSGDLAWNSNRNHVLLGYSTGSSDYNNYLTLSGLSLSQPKSRISYNFPGNSIKVNIVYEYDNIIFQVMNDANEVTWGECLWKSSGFSRNIYSILSTQRQIATNVQDTAGLEVNNNAIFGQVKTSSGQWQSYYAGYTSGDAIGTSYLFDTALDGKLAMLVNSDSGLGYNIIIDNNNRIVVYEGSSTNPSAGYTKVYTSTMQLSGTDLQNMQVVMFETSWALTFTGIDVPNLVHFVNSNDVRTDNYIGNVKTDVAQGDWAEVFVGLPVIAHNARYNPGDIFYLGPYKYQAITRHQVVVILEEVVPVSAV